MSWKRQLEIAIYIFKVSKKAAGWEMRTEMTSMRFSKDQTIHLTIWSHREAVRWHWKLLQLNCSEFELLLKDSSHLSDETI
jgi:hypothetical protein